MAEGLALPLQKCGKEGCDCDDSLKSHISAVHEGKKPLESLEQGFTPISKQLSFGCRCGNRFLSQRNLDSHISNVHNKNLYYVQCRFVRKSINFITHPIRYGPPLNLLSNYGQKSWEQKIPGSGFEENPLGKGLEKSREPFRPLKLLKTPKVYEEKKVFKCPICKVGFTKKGDQKSHISTVHEGNKIEGTPILQLEMVRRFREYIRQKNSSPGSKGLEKSRDFGTSRQNSLVGEPICPLKLLKTSTVHEEKKAFKCPICKVGFTKNISSADEGKQLLKCPKCEARFLI